MSSWLLRVHNLYGQRRTPREVRMRIYMRLLISAFGVSLLALTALAIPAAARNRVEFETSNPTVVLTGQLIFSDPEGIAKECLFTLSATLHRLVAKTVGALAGYITDGRANECVGGVNAFVILAEPATPIHLQYGSITGTLPTITGATIRIAFAFSLRIINGFRNTCLYRGEIQASARENPFARVSISGSRIPLFRRIEGIACFATIDIVGTLSSATRTTIRLLEIR